MTRASVQILLLVLVLSVAGAVSRQNDCNANKAEKIAEMEAKLAKAKADMQAIYRRIADLTQHHEWEKEVTNLDQVRLVNGSTNSEGRVEIFVDTQWSPVSLGGFRATDADPVRLVDGAGPYEGRVEIQVGGQWGSICHNNWDNRDAQVVCRSLGYDGDGATAVSYARFGQGTGPVWLDTLQCAGSENHLFECPMTDAVGKTGCNHGGDAGVICDNWFRYPVRLVNGSGPWEGRVEFHAFGEWRPVLSSEWDDNDARVVCNMLGYTDSHAIAVGGNGYNRDTVFGPGSGNPWLYDVRCNGSETHLLQCFSPSAIDPIRLVGGKNYTEGRVEIQVNEEWGTVCNDGWDTNEARVVCRQLGFDSGNARAWTNNHFGQGSGHPYLDDMACTGSESYLLQCEMRGVGIAQCSSGANAGVSC
ncbi:hypothetical protein BaRGS_00027715 [Batillaria attramentaria]|uniref:SRCR domain-containing protein n=1 Tax=Batillaria attramentaria TaxID=370345 RepID=A0ABD0K205_9CAEN